ncbi:MAG: cardiolipin synthase B, partial [Thermoanaerobaculia bacterium]|nr:cardiolipin synthase B [Thermoanaerobaculia bacterium]
MNKTRRKLFLRISLAVLATAAVTVLLLNFSTGEKKIEKQISSLYGVADPQFGRAMGSLLGPAILD